MAKMCPFNSFNCILISDICQYKNTCHTKIIIIDITRFLLVNTDILNKVNLLMHFNPQIHFFMLILSLISAVRAIMDIW